MGEPPFFNKGGMGGVFYKSPFRMEEFFDKKHILTNITGWNLPFFSISSCQSGSNFPPSIDPPGAPVEVKQADHLSQGRSTPWSLGMGDLQPLMTGILIMGPYKPLRTWVDFPIPYYMEIM